MAAAPSERAFWGIHARGAMLPTILLKRNQLAIGWADLGDLSSEGKDRERLRAMLTLVIAPDKASSIPQVAGQLYRFINELKNGDVVA